MISPITFRWTGSEMLPIHPGIARRQFEPGQTYALIQHEERSSASHKHYHASIAEAHANLPEEWALRLPTPEHLRRYALVKAGFCDSQTFTASSSDEAQRLAAFIQPVDEFSVVTVDGATITRYTAKSQSYRAMGREDFQRSKDAVLEIVAGMIGVERRDLEQARAA